MKFLHVLFTIGAIAAPSQVYKAKMEPIVSGATYTQHAYRVYTKTFDMNKHYTFLGKDLSSSIRFHFDMPPSFGYSATLSPEELELVRSEPDVEAVEVVYEGGVAESYTHEDSIENGTYTSDNFLAKRDTQNNVGYNLAHLSATTKDTGGTTYNYVQGAGSKVNIWIVDSGINVDHVEFGGRALNAADFSGENDMNDLQGHGTHVASIAAGATYGVAKSANIIGLKVLDKNNRGSSDKLEAALNYMQQNFPGVKPGLNGNVINLSLVVETTRGVRDRIRALTNMPGTKFVAAAGNENLEVYQAPAIFGVVTTVASCDQNYVKTASSNYGNKINLIAPGARIRGALFSDTTSSVLKSGTSQAAPHVAGIIAIFLSQEIGITSAQIDQRLDINADEGYVTGFNSDTRNLFANTGFGKGDPYIKP